MDRLAHARHAGRVYLMLAIICIELAYFNLLGAAIAGDISDAGVWVVEGVLVLVGVSAFAAWKSDDRP